MTKTTGRTAFEEAYDLYYGVIYSFIFSLVGTSDEAGDLCQDTFLKLYHQLAEQPIAHTKSWLYRVASNLCFNHLKRKKIFANILTRHPGVHTTVQPDKAEQSIIAEQERRMVRAALEKLKPRDRVLLMLSQDKIPYQEMASILDIKPASVGKILCRAREKLAKQILNIEKAYPLIPGHSNPRSAS